MSFVSLSKKKLTQRFAKHQTACQAFRLKLVIWILNIHVRGRPHTLEFAVQSFTHPSELISLSSSRDSKHQCQLLLQNRGDHDSDVTRFKNKTACQASSSRSSNSRASPRSQVYCSLHSHSLTSSAPACSVGIPHSSVNLIRRFQGQLLLQNRGNHCCRRTLQEYTQVETDFGQTDFGQTDFGHPYPTNFGQTDFGQS